MRYYDIIQGSPEWMELRTGKLTGSCFAKIMKSTYLDFADQILAEQLTGLCQFDDVYQSVDIIRGKDLEPVAIQQYEIATQSVSTKCGFIQSDKYEWIGSSPDAIVKSIQDGNVEGIIEVKCPRPKNHLKYIRQNKIPNDYIGQVVSYFIVDDKIQFVDFVSFCEDIELKPLWIKRITREEAVDTINEYIEAIERFSEALNKFKNNLIF
jgi:hypothetical protein